MREPQNEEIKITGTVSSVVYRNEENGYSVLALETPAGETTVVGCLPDAEAGEVISAIGEWVQHREYGKQLRIKEYERELPQDTEAMLRYLASGAVRGIRAKTAVKIIRRFGADTFDVLEHHPAWLSQIPGISPKKAQEIGESFAERSGMRSLLMLCGDALSPAAAMRVYKRWGNAAARLIEENPYRVASEFEGIGFEKADKLAAHIGFGGDPAFRIRCGILQTLQTAASQGGHCCLPPEELYAGAAHLLGAAEEDLRRETAVLLSLGELTADPQSRRIYLASLWNTECSIAERLIRLDHACARVGVEELEGLIHVVETESGITYAGLQRRAIYSAVDSGVSIITGGPGTGKTTVIRALIRIFEEMGLSCALAAPTGRAAKRMSQTTAHEARTIHRLLEMDYAGENGGAVFAKDENTPIEARVIIIDEASMLDLSLCGALLRAIRPGCRLILIGDSDQLPPVGAGNILHDLIESGAFPTVRLTEIFRQAEESLIVRNAHAVNAGKMPELSSVTEDFFFLRRPSAQSTAETIVELCRKRLPASYGEMGRSGVQVISPSRRGAAGTEALNLLLREALNPKSDRKAEKEIAGRLFREGDKVMQTKNNYQLTWRAGNREGLGVFNGDIGTLLRFDPHTGGAQIRFDDRTAEYDLAAFENLELAYAVTVHKSQGNEYPIVIFPAYACAPLLQTRNMLYTALTRAQTYVIIVGDADIVRRMTENDAEATRYSGLTARIRERIPTEN